MKIIRFATDYPKLNDILFTTIRATPKKLRPGHVCQIESPSMDFKAILVKTHTITLREMDTEDLLHDTNTTSREGALAELREYYPDLEEDSDVQVLWFVQDRRP